MNLREDLGRSEQAVSELQSAIDSIKRPPQTYKQWIDQHDLSEEDASYEADPDADGSPNYLEFAFGTNPTISRFHHHPFIRSKGNQLTLSYRQAKDVSGVLIRMNQSQNLIDWIEFIPAPADIRKAQFPSFTLNEITIPIQSSNQHYFEINITVQDISLNPR